MTSRTRSRPACSCGARTFGVRIDRTQEVGLVTCSRGHHALLLDSRDHWDDVIQDGRPKEIKCRCAGRMFEITLAYTFREDSSDVRHVEVQLRCSGCHAEHTAVTFQIDYGPTKKLIQRPLDPIAEPWLKARRVSITGYWVPTDVGAVVTQLESLGAIIYFAARQKRPVRRTARQTIQALARAEVYDLFLAEREVSFPADLRDCWKRLPVIHLRSPIRMGLGRGTGTLYYLEWATEILRAGRVEPQDEPFLDLARRALDWLPTHFTAKGKRSFHNPRELARLDLG